MKEELLKLTFQDQEANKVTFRIIPLVKLKSSTEIDSDQETKAKAI